MRKDLTPRDPIAAERVLEGSHRGQLMDKDLEGGNEPPANNSFNNMKASPSSNQQQPYEVEADEQMIDFFVTAMEGPLECTGGRVRQVGNELKPYFMTRQERFDYAKEKALKEEIKKKAKEKALSTPLRETTKWDKEDARDMWRGQGRLNSNAKAKIEVGAAPFDVVKKVSTSVTGAERAKEKEFLQADRAWDFYDPSEARTSCGGPRFVTGGKHSQHATAAAAAKKKLDEVLRTGQSSKEGRTDAAGNDVDEGVFLTQGHSVSGRKKKPSLGESTSSLSRKEGTLRSRNDALVVGGGALTTTTSARGHFESVASFPSSELEEGPPQSSSTRSLLPMPPGAVSTTTGDEFGIPVDKNGLPFAGYVGSDLKTGNTFGPVAHRGGLSQWKLKHHKYHPLQELFGVLKGNTFTNEKEPAPRPPSPKNLSYAPVSVDISAPNLRAIEFEGGARGGSSSSLQQEQQHTSTRRKSGKPPRRMRECLRPPDALLDSTKTGLKTTGLVPWNAHEKGGNLNQGLGDKLNKAKDLIREKAQPLLITTSARGTLPTNGGEDKNAIGEPSLPPNEGPPGGKGIYGLGREFSYLAGVFHHPGSLNDGDAATDEAMERRKRLRELQGQISSAEDSDAGAVREKTRQARMEATLRGEKGIESAQDSTTTEDSSVVTTTPEDEGAEGPGASLIVDEVAQKKHERKVRKIASKAFSGVMEIEDVRPPGKKIIIISEQ